MNKLFKKIMAVGMAAVMASSMAVVSSAKETTPPDPNTDKVVWVNGKDVKDKTDKTKITRYKTEILQATGKYAGGKWMVAVTDSTVTTVKDFVALFDSKLKNTKASETKDIAKAKLKDGKITITAGKKAGKVNIWVYEVNSKKIVSASAKAENTVQITGVEPFIVNDTEKPIEVKNAPSGLTYAPNKVEEDKSTNALKKIEKTVKITDDIVAGAKTSVDVAIGDKKADIDKAATFKATSANDNVTLNTDDKGVFTDGVLQITGAKAGKFNITVTCDQSGKSVKISGVVLSKPDAPKPTGAAGKITGVDKTMEYTKVEGSDSEPAKDATWTAIKGTEVELAEGYYCVRVKAVKNKSAASDASSAVKVSKPATTSSSN